MGSGSGSAQEGSSSVQSLDESSLDAAPLPPPRFSYLRTNDTLSTSSEANMEDAIALVMHLNSGIFTYPTLTVFQILPKILIRTKILKIIVESVVLVK